MALIYAMVLGADSIDDCEVLRAGRTGRLLGGWMPAPSTLGTFLRAFTFGHVRQLDALLGRALERAWQAGAGPGEGRLVIDVDSFVGEVCGRLKQGAAYGYTKLLGYHPILATRADTREALHIRLRKGSANSQKGMLRFTEELIARVNRAGASGVKLLRADSGFWNTRVFERLEKAGWQYSIGVRMQKGIREAVEAIDEEAWQPIDYPEQGEAQIAESRYGGRRLIVRRTRLVGAQAELWPDWRHFAFLTNREEEELAIVEAEHREHAVVEQVIADLKDQALAHFPSGQFNANGAWVVLAALAHNLLRWTQSLGLPATTVRAARTLRRRLLGIPGRLTRHARGWTLHLPARWPWHGDYLNALTRIRALPAGHLTPPGRPAIHIDPPAPPGALLRRPKRQRNAPARAPDTPPHPNQARTTISRPRPTSPARLHALHQPDRWIRA